MTEPVFSLIECVACRAQPEPIDIAVGGGPLAILTRFADRACPLSGTGCPNSSTYQAVQTSRLPAKLRDDINSLNATAISALTSRVAALEAAAARYPVIRLAPPILLGAMLLNATAPITVTWTAPMPTATYDVAISESRVTIVSITSRTTTGCVITVRATAVITLAVTVTIASVGWSA